MLLVGFSVCIYRLLGIVWNIAYDSWICHGTFNSQTHCPKCDQNLMERNRSFRIPLFWYFPVFIALNSMRVCVCYPKKFLFTFRSVFRLRAPLPIGIRQFLWWRLTIAITVWCNIDNIAHFMSFKRTRFFFFIVKHPLHSFHLFQRGIDDGHIQFLFVSISNLLFAGCEVSR